MMLIGWNQTIVMGTAYMVFYLIDFGFIILFARQRKSRSWHPGYTLVGLAVMMVLCLQPALWPGLGLQTRSVFGAVAQLVGIALVGLSLGLQIWARAHLRHFYAEGADVQPGHQVIDTGPYAYMRHPLFVSYYLFTLGLLGIGLSLPILAVVIYTFWDFHRAALADERLLSAEVPGYAEYLSRTPRYVPRIGKVNISKN